MPIRTVLLTGLTKFDGNRTRHLKAREFHQVAGRAGRAGYDTDGYVVVQAPEHVIENERALAKAGDDPKKRRKVVKKKAPEGFVSWGQKTFDKLVAAEPEPLVSSFNVTHAMLLNVISRPGDTYAAMRRLLTDNHESRPAQRKHMLRAIAIYRALVAAGVVEQLGEPDEQGRLVRLTMDLQFDFALNQPLSPFALAAIELLDPESPSYAVDVLSIIEATLDDPRQVLGAQQAKERGEAIARMKAEGVEYEQRMEVVEEITHPQPLADMLEAAYETYRQGHPWVSEHEVSPKSVARDMYERAMNFVEFVNHYSLARSEGLVLRYLADVYKALRHTVPYDAKSEELGDIIEWLGELVRQVDSSLLDEWERLRNPSAESPEGEPVDEGPAKLTENTRAFRVQVRNAVFRRVELAARERFDELAALEGENGFTAEDWQAAMDEYFEEYDELATDADARGPALFMVTEESQRWLVRQVFADPSGDRDWGISAEVDLPASDEAGVAVVRVTSVGRFEQY